MKNPFAQLLHPEKYKEKIEIKKIVAAPKFYRKGVDKYKEKILAGDSIKPIVVLKHPHEDLYAVLDGHHRFYAFYELGFQEIEAAVIKTNTKFLFNKTKEGWLQPTPKMTRYIHIPAIILGKYVNSFVKNPRKILAARPSLPKLKSPFTFLKKQTKTA